MAGREEEEVGRLGRMRVQAGWEHSALGRPHSWPAVFPSLGPHGSHLSFPDSQGSFVFPSQLSTFMMNCNPMQFSKGFIFIYTLWVINKWLGTKPETEMDTQWQRGPPYAHCQHPYKGTIANDLLYFFPRDSVNTYIPHIHTVLHIAPSPYSVIWFGKRCHIGTHRAALLTVKMEQNPTYGFTTLYKSPRVEGLLVGCRSLAIVSYPVVLGNTSTKCREKTWLQQEILG